MKNVFVSIVGSGRAADAMLVREASRLAVKDVSPLTSLSAVRDGLPLRANLFVFFSPVRDVASLAPLVRKIRLTESSAIRFAPLFYFCAEASREIIRGCMAIGFDDVIVLPVTAIRIEAHMLRQLDRRITYAETAGYFGPERKKSASLVECAHDLVSTISFERSSTDGVTLLTDPPMRRLA